MTLREIFISASFALCGCGATDGRQVVLEGFAEGTTYRIVIVIPRAGDATGLQRQVDSLFAAVESSMSIYDSASLISRLNDNRTDSLDGLITYCIRLANRVSEESGGLYDVTIMPLTRAWGFGSSSGSGSGAGVGEGAPNI
ncbi:MAG: FAD:protein FMN transferase, partial [Rikenellaceae bacterium]|nr:FAD:protein FMN transferase [Rikenellaceae bacterium]